MYRLIRQLEHIAGRVFDIDFVGPLVNAYGGFSRLRTPRDFARMADKLSAAGLLR